MRTSTLDALGILCLDFECGPLFFFTWTFHNVHWYLSKKSEFSSTTVRFQVSVSKDVWSNNASYSANCLVHFKLSFCMQRRFVLTTQCWLFHLNCTVDSRILPPAGWQRVTQPSAGDLVRLGWSGRGRCCSLFSTVDLWEALRVHNDFSTLGPLSLLLHMVTSWGGQTIWELGVQRGQNRVEPKIFNLVRDSSQVETSKWMSAHHLFGGPSLADRGQVCRSSEGCLCTKASHYPTSESLLQQCSKCPTCSHCEKSKMPTECHHCLWATELQIKLSDKTELKSTYDKSIERCECLPMLGVVPCEGPQ